MPVRPPAPYRTAYPARRAGRAGKLRLLWAHTCRALGWKLIRRRRRLDARHAPPPLSPTPVYPRGHGSASGLWFVGVLFVGTLQALRMEANHPGPIPPPLPPPSFATVPVRASVDSAAMDRIRADLGPAASAAKAAPNAPRAHKPAKPRIPSHLPTAKPYVQP